MSKKLIFVCGGRDFTDKDFLFDTLDRELGGLGTPEFDQCPPTIISGGARGADTLAIDWAVINCCHFIEELADWNTHGKKAGILRTLKIFNDYKPDLVIAFPGGKGTKFTVEEAKKRNIPVKEIQIDRDINKQ